MVPRTPTALSALGGVQTAVYAHLLITAQGTYTLTLWSNMAVRACWGDEQEYFQQQSASTSASTGLTGA